MYTSGSTNVTFDIIFFIEGWGWGGDCHAVYGEVMSCYTKLIIITCSYFSLYCITVYVLSYLTKRAATRNSIKVTFMLSLVVDAIFLIQFSKANIRGKK